MSWDEQFSNPPPNGEIAAANNIQIERPATPKWLAVLFKTVGVLNSLIAGLSIIVIALEYQLSPTLPWYFWLIQLSSLAIFAVLGYGLYKLLRWAGSLLVVGAAAGVCGLLYSIIAGSNIANAGFLLSLVPTAVYIILSVIFVLKRGHFMGKYFHPVFTPLVVVLGVAVAIVSWSSSGSFLNILNGKESGSSQSYSLAAVSLDTSTWLSYHNEEYGFDMKYPSELPVALGINLPSVKDASGNFASRDYAHAINKTLLADGPSLGVVFDFKDSQFGWSDWTPLTLTGSEAYTVSGLNGTLQTGYSYNYDHPNDPSFSTIQFVSAPFTQNGQEMRLIIHLDRIPTSKLATGRQLFSKITSLINLKTESANAVDGQFGGVPSSTYNSTPYSYKDDNNTFSFRYPYGWTLKDLKPSTPTGDHTIIIESPNSPTENRVLLSVEIWQSIGPRSADAQITQSEKLTPSKLEERSINVGGMPATEFIENDFPGSWIILEKSGYTYTISSRNIPPAVFESFYGSFTFGE